MLIVALKNRYKASTLLARLGLARSSYFCHRARIALEDKYLPVRYAMKEASEPHAFRCTSDAPGHLLILNAPGRMHVDFFRGVGRPLADDSTLPVAPDGPPDMARVMRVAKATGMTLLPSEPEVAR